MSKFEDILRDVGRTVKGSAENVRDYAKVKYNLTRENGEITTLLEELGRMAYEAKKSGEPIPEHEYALICEALDEGYATVENLRDEQNKILGRIECPACRRMIDRGYEFCPHCGAPIGKKDGCCGDDCDCASSDGDNGKEDE